MTTTAETIFIGGAGPRIACELVGSNPDAPLVLCAHGNSSHRGIWRLVSRLLQAELDVRMVLIDMRGHGDSDHVSPPAYNPGDHADDLARVVQHFAPARYALVGHSAGALATAAFAARCLEKQAACAPPRALVWVDIDPCVPAWQVEFFNTRAESVGRAYPDAEAATRALVRGIQKTSPGAPEEILWDFIAAGLKQTAQGYTVKLDPQTYATWAPGDLRPILPRLTCPTLVIHGSKSIVSTAPGVADLRAGLPRGELAEIQDGTHFLPLDRPAEVARTIAEFLRRELMG